MMRALVAALLWVTSSAFAQETSPSKTVRLLAAAAPGGNPDVLGRMLAAKLSVVRQASQAEASRSRDRPRL